MDILNSLAKVNFGTESIGSKMVKMYLTREVVEKINIAAEADNVE